MAAKGHCQCSKRRSPAPDPGVPLFLSYRRPWGPESPISIKVRNPSVELGNTLQSRSFQVALPLGRGKGTRKARRCLQMRGEGGGCRLAGQGEKVGPAREGGPVTGNWINTFGAG